MTSLENHLEDLRLGTKDRGSIQRRGKWHGTEMWKIYDSEAGLERKGVRSRESWKEVTVAPQVRKQESGHCLAPPGW